MNDAQILDRGYRRYEGPRGQVWAAMRTLIRFSFERALGMRRGFWAKVIPALIIVIAFLPAVVFIGIASLLPDAFAEAVPSYGDYYGFIVSALVLYTAFLAPELLCNDRRTRLLGLYLASPLNRLTYLASKALTAVLALSIITIGPLLMLLLAYSLQGQGPGNVVDYLTLLGRIFLAGAAITAIYTSLAFAVASFTDRMAVAAASIIMALLGSQVLTSVLVNGADWPVWMRLFSLVDLPLDIVERLYFGSNFGEPSISNWAYLVAIVAWSGVLSALVIRRYQRLDVTR